MAKKTTLLLIISVLLIAMFAFVACKNDPVVPPTPQEPVVNKAGEVSDNLVYNGNLEDGSSSDLSGDGANVAVVGNEGYNNSHALHVEQTENYGEVLVDISDLYGRGKSYYVEAKFRNAGPEGRADDLNAKIDFNVVSGVGYEKTGHDYDIPGQYDGSWLDADSASNIFDIEIELDASAGTPIVDDDWVTISAVLDAEQIESLLVNQTKLCGGGDVTLYKLAIVFYVGTYAEKKEGEVYPGPVGQEGYIYYLDEVVIKDLNSELKRTGRTYQPVDPEPEPEDDPDQE